MEYLSSDKILIVDLTKSEVTEEDLSEELVKEKIGGSGITKYLYEQYEQEEPIIIGTGLLTGTLYPASAAGVLTAKSPRTGKIAHVPVTQKVAIELKYSGFDYVVIKGKSEKPVFLWLHDGVADISDASDVWGKDAWQTTDSWRKELGEDIIQTMVIGQAGEQGQDFAQIILNYWPSGDRFSFGKVFGQKNLKGTALRGMGLLEVADPEAFLDRSLELLSDIKNSKLYGKNGLTDILSAMGEEDTLEWISPLVHSHIACYNTPFATNTFVFLDEEPKQIKETAQSEPGLMLTDVFALLGLKKAGYSAEESCRILKACAKEGLDGFAISECLQKQDKTNLEEVTKSLKELSGDIPIPGKGVFSPWSPNQPLIENFGVNNDSAEIQDWWERRQAISYIFGIHPIFAVMSPQLTEDNLLELVNIGTELDLSQEDLDTTVSRLLP